jgi:hypothetical protein
MVEKPNYYLKDRQRCAFGLGWEYRRRGQSIDENPFDPDHWKHAAFREGFEKFKEPGST